MADSMGQMKVATMVHMMVAKLAATKEWTKAAKKAEKMVVMTVDKWEYLTVAMTVESMDCWMVGAMAERKESRKVAVMGVPTADALAAKMVGMMAEMKEKLMAE